MDAHYRRQVATEAIEQVLKGARPADLESDTLDFKEESGTVRHDRERQPIPEHHEPAAKALAEEAACFANSSRGGVLVVGVNERVAGPAALVGAYLDTVWLRQRIYDLTQPPLALDILEEQTVAGQRIYLINIAPALEEIRCGGKLRARFGSQCQELSGDQARLLLEGRRRYDWSAEPSGFRLSSAVPSALALAASYYKLEHGRVTGDDKLGLVSRLGLLADDSRDQDPELNNAGALLLCEFEPDSVQLDVLVTRAEGAVSRRRIERAAPLLVGFEDARQLLLECFPTQPAIIGILRRSLRPVPERAFREAVVNALMHRDYRQVWGRIVVQVIGDPSAVLKVLSPGGFPPGVQPDRLLTTPSRPRNPALAHALHVLGLAEREAIGIDSMFIEMLRDGHPDPVIVEDGGNVLCILRGGAVDIPIRTFFDSLSESHPALGENVRTYLAITQLLRATPLRVDDLAARAQCTYQEAFDILEQLTVVGVTERLLDRSRSFRLTVGAIDHLKTRLAYTPRVAIEEHWELVRAYLDSHADIGRQEAARLLGVGPVRASRILSELHNQRQLLALVGGPRGRGVRYQLREATV